MRVLTANQTGWDFGRLVTLYPDLLGHLYSPGKGRADPREWCPYALDNGAFIAWNNGEPWDESAWRAMLVWSILSGIVPLWVLVPDAVGDRKGTLERWREYAPLVRRLGHRRLAFAVQDGMTFDDVPQDAEVIFLGGTDEESWKDKAIGPWCARFPGRVHVGRVNGWDRLMACYRAGAVSVDGTRWFQRQQSDRPKSQYAQLLRYLEFASKQPRRPT